MVLDIIVKLCAIGGFLLGIFNFYKARKKDKKEANQEYFRANQHLVKAEYRKGYTDTKRRAGDLYIVNTDTHPVTCVRVRFFIDPNGKQPNLIKELASIGPGEDVFIHQFTHGGTCYKAAEINYIDSSGNKHEYIQESI